MTDKYHLAQRRGLYVGRPRRLPSRIRCRTPREALLALAVLLDTDDVACAVFERMVL